MKETKEMVGFVLDVASALVDAKSDDGKITLTDAPKFFGAMISAPGAIIGADQIGDELHNMTVEDKADLVETFRKRFDIPDDQVEELVEDSVEAALGLTNVIIRIVRFRKEKL